MKKIEENFKYLATDSGQAKLSLAHKKFFAKIHGGNHYFEEDFVCSSDEDDDLL